MPVDHAHLATSPKSFALPPVWTFEDELEHRYALSVALEIDYVIVEGLYLEGHCICNLPDQDVTFVLVHKPAVGLAGPLMRFDWNPLHTHGNKGLGKAPWKYAPITATHHHAFPDNFALGWERMVEGSLPIAYPVADSLPNFRDMLAYVGMITGIRDIQRIPEPEWSQRLI